VVNSPLFLAALVVAVVFMLAGVGYFAYFSFTSGAGTTTPATGQAAGSNILPQAAATQEKRSLPPLKELIAAGKLDTPQEIAEYMRNNFGYAETEASRTVDEFLVYGKGVGDSTDFFKFFFRALVLQSCKWNVRTYVFVTANESGGWRAYDPATPIVFFTDSGNNYYFVAEHPDFPIIPIGQATDPIPFEEQRLGKRILRDYGYLEDQIKC
jgi:hypothetical protein